MTGSNGWLAPFDHEAAKAAARGRLAQLRHARLRGAMLRMVGDGAFSAGHDESGAYVLRERGLVRFLENPWAQDSLSHILDGDDRACVMAAGGRRAAA